MVIWEEIGSGGGGGGKKTGGGEGHRTRRGRENGMGLGGVEGRALLVATHRDIERERKRGRKRREQRKRRRRRR